MVSGHHQGRRAGRLRARARLHGRTPHGLRDLGGPAGQVRQGLQGNGACQRLFPAADPFVVFAEGSRARRGLRPRVRGRHSRRRRRAGRAARHPPHVRDGHRRDVQQVGAVVARSAPADQPVGQRAALGKAPPPVPPSSSGRKVTRPTPRPAKPRKRP